MSEPLLVVGVMLVALVAYAVTGGADFGGGVWDLLASGERRAAQREVIARAIAPIWEANHVWLILVVVVLFTCFPPAFAQVSIILHIPLTIMLLGIVVRGSAFTFRSYEPADDRRHSGWGRLFALASVVTPFTLGIIVGSIASGAVGRAPLADPSASFADVYVRPWLTPFAASVGLLTLTVFSYLAAVYLTLETRDRLVQDDFRLRAMGTAAAVAIVGAVTLVLGRVDKALVSDEVLATTWARVLLAITLATAITVVVALVQRRFRLARIAVAAQTALMMLGWALAQYPLVVPPRLTVFEAAAPASTLTAVLISLAVGAIILFPALAYLYRVFKARFAQSGRS